MYNHIHYFIFGMQQGSVSLHQVACKLAGTCIEKPTSWMHLRNLITLVLTRQLVASIQHQVLLISN